MSDLSLLAYTIRNKRTQLQLSQTDLAIACKLDPSYISRIEGNQLGYAPSREAIAALAAALDLDEYRLQLMARHIPDEMLDMVCDFLLAYPKERIEEVLEIGFYAAIL